MISPWKGKMFNNYGGVKTFHVFLNPLSKHKSVLTKLYFYQMVYGMTYSKFDSKWDVIYAKLSEP